jgi:hypothetical protein
VTPKFARRALGAIIVACLGLTAVTVLARPAPSPASSDATLVPARQDPGLTEPNIVVDPNPGSDEGTIMIRPTRQPTPTPRPTHKP